jgi:hypothetical protein
MFGEVKEVSARETLTIEAIIKSKTLPVKGIGGL